MGVSLSKDSPVFLFVPGKSCYGVHFGQTIVTFAGPKGFYHYEAISPTSTMCSADADCDFCTDGT